MSYRILLIWKNNFFHKQIVLIIADHLFASFHLFCGFILVISFKSLNFKVCLAITLIFNSSTGFLMGALLSL